MFFTAAKYLLFKKGGIKMSYDFTTLVSRKNTGSSKWEQMYSWNPEVTEDVVPLSVADMEFKPAPSGRIKKIFRYSCIGIYKSLSSFS